MTSPRTLKEVQSLNRKLASLNRFLSKAAEKSLLFFKTINRCIKKSNFAWTAEAEKALKDIKKQMAKLPTLTTPIEGGKTLIMYLSATGEPKGTPVKGKSKEICDVRGNLIPKVIPWTMVKMRRSKTSQLRDSRDTRRLMQHTLRSLVGRAKSNAVGILLADNAHGRPNGDQSMLEVPSAHTHTTSPKNKAEANHISMAFP
nr:reverse transcriptase domain-containing protein [Tanacetum cinerariifolium]